MRILLALSLAATMACSDDSDDTTDPTGSTGSTDTGGGIPAGTSGLEGVVTSEASTPVTDVNVQYCRGTSACYLPESFENGEYVYSGLTPGVGTFKLIPQDGTNWAAVVLPYTVANDSTVTVDVTMLERENLQTIPETTTEVEVAPGIWMTIGQDTVTNLGLAESSTEFHISDASDVAPAIEGLEETEVLGVWYLGPYHHAADASVRMTNIWDVADGEASLYYIEPNASEWHEVGTANVVDGELTFDGKITELTTLVLAR